MAACSSSCEVAEAPLAQSHDFCSKAPWTVLRGLAIWGNQGRAFYCVWGARSDHIHPMTRCGGWADKVRRERWSTPGAVAIPKRHQNADIPAPVRCWQAAFSRARARGSRAPKVVRLYPRAKRGGGREGDILRFRGERNLYSFFGFCTTYGGRETSIVRVSVKFEV